MGGAGRRAVGKLKWAGEAWAHGRLTASQSEAAEDAIAFGLDPALVDGPDGEGLWEENEEALQAFVAVASQWRTVSVGECGVVWIGLDYSAVAAGFALGQVAITPALWADVQVIEIGARAALNRIGTS